MLLHSDHIVQHLCTLNTVLNTHFVKHLCTLNTGLNTHFEKHLCTLNTVLRKTFPMFDQCDLFKVYKKCTKLIKKYNLSTEGTVYTINCIF